MSLAGHRNNPHDRVRDLIDENTLEHWWLSYVDLLQKLQLFTKANEVRTKYFYILVFISLCLLQTETKIFLCENAFKILACIVWKTMLQFKYLNHKIVFN